MKKHLFLFSVLFIPLFLLAQDNSINEWKMVMEREQISATSLQELAPHFPSLMEAKTNKELNLSVAKWRSKYDSEWKTLDEKLGLTDKYSLVYLGLFTAQEYASLVANKFTHGWLEWIAAANISDRRLNEIAPNLPKAPANATAEYKPQYEHEFEMWRVLYGHEYEALINAPEIAAINENYTGYVNTMIMPKYLRALQSEEFPTKQTSKDPFFDELLFELDKQTWYFIFEPNVFKREYGFEPILPEDFDASAFRNQVKERIELNKRIEAGEIQAKDDMK